VPSTMSPAFVGTVEMWGNPMIAGQDLGILVVRRASRQRYRQLRILRRCAYEAEENACNRSTPHQYALHRAPPNHNEI